MARASQRPPTAAEARAELARRAARARLLPFAILTYPGHAYRPSWHHERLAAALEAVEAGEIQRLMVFMPPQHGKSELCSVRFPAWYMGRRLGRRPRVIVVSHTLRLAQTFSRQVRNLISDRLYQEIFPGVQLQPDVKSATLWHTADGGTYNAAGREGGISGFGADLMVIDDPLKDWETADSPVTREAIWDWWQTTASTRLSSRGAVVLPMTRWHGDDLAGRLLEETRKGGERWDVIEFPALAERVEPGRAEGEGLWPGGGFTTEWLLAKRAATAPRHWLALYQQRPPKDVGAIFPRERWRWYPELPPHPRMVVISIDTASKAKERNDWSVAQVWHVREDGDYLADQWRAHVEFPELKQAVIGLHAKHRAGVVLIEDKSSGESLIQDLQRSTLLPVEPFDPGGSDLTIRAESVCGMQRAGRLFLPEGAPFALDFVEEHTAFPHGQHDDQVAAQVQFQLWRREMGGEQRIQVGGRRESAGFVDRFAGAGVMEQRGMARTPEELHRREPDRRKKGPYSGY